MRKPYWKYVVRMNKGKSEYCMPRKGSKDHQKIMKKMKKRRKSTDKKKKTKTSSQQAMKILRTEIIPNLRKGQLSKNQF